MTFSKFQSLVAESVQHVLNVSKWHLLGMFTVGFVTYKLLTRPRNLPPGPMGKPFMGAASHLTGDLPADISRLGTQYGDIISLYLGPKLKVFLNSREAIQEVLVTRGEEFANRSFDTVHSLLNLNDEIFMAEYGEKWKRDKRFLMGAVRSMGFGSASAEDKIQIEAGLLVERLIDRCIGSQAGIDMADDMACATASVICNVIYNRRYDPDSPELQQLLDMNRNMFDIDSKEAVLLDFLPMWLLNVAFPGLCKKFQDRGDKMIHFLMEKAHEHAQSYTPGQPRDFMDVYIEGKGPENTDHRQLAATCIAFMQDAIDTLAATICYALLLITTHKEIQQKIHQEIDTHVGRSRPPTLQDRSKLAYLEAVCLETLRYVTPVALTPSHAARRSAQLRGYTIPRNVAIVANLHAVHHDPRFFPEPNEFRPERFLDGNGRLKKHECFMGFSLGPRKCISEQLVRMEMFLFLANIFHRCLLSFPEDQPRPSLLPQPVFTVYKPQAFRLLLTER